MRVVVQIHPAVTGIALGHGTSERGCSGVVRANVCGYNACRYFGHIDENLQATRETGCVCRLLPCRLVLPFVRADTLLV